jgi:hypothetical protein
MYAHVQRRSAFLFLVSFFFCCVLVPMEKERVSEQDGRTDRRVNCSHTYTHSFVLLLSISQMTLKKNKKNRWTCSIHVCKYIYLLQLASDQLYVPSEIGGKIVRWREHGMSGEEKKE